MLHDVFLSHHSADKPAVEELARRLKEQGLKPWLDKWHLVPGDPWQPALEDALTNSATCAVFIGPSGLGPWQNAEMRAAISRQVSERAGQFRVIPVLLPGAERGDRSKLPLFLTANTWVEFRRTLDDATAFERLVWGITGKKAADPDPALAGRCPYKGLRYFEVEDAPFFHGRDALTEWLLDKLQLRPRRPEPARFFAITGASGSGKSSLARAGLVAKLKDGAIEGSHDWPQLILRPGPNPLESLAIALCSKELKPGSDADTASKLIQSLQKEDATLHREVRIALHGTPEDRRVLLLVDQFEEVFTLCDKEELRRAFIANLLHVATVAQGRVWVVLALRADFYGKCATYPDLAAAVSEHQFLVGPMSEDELRVAVERPAQLVGGEVEPALVEQLVQQMKDEPGALPLLQDTLQELWNKPGRGRALTQDDYKDMGGLGGALEKRANDVLQSLSNPERERCRQIFLRLVQPGEGTEDTKRRARLSELSSPADNGSDATSIIGKLVEARLLAHDGERDGAGKLQPDATLEVAHEALIRSWSELRKWVDADRAGLRTHRRLGEAANEWEANRRDPGYLFSGGRLALAQEWAAKHESQLSSLETVFLEVSGEAEQQRKDDQVKAARQLAHETEARRQAEEARANEAIARERDQTRAKRRLSVFATICAALAVMALVAAFRSQIERGKSKQAQAASALAATNALRAKLESDAAKSEALTAQRKAAASEREANANLAQVNWGVGQSFREGANPSTTQSPIKATHYLLRAAVAAEKAGDPAGRDNACLAARYAGGAIDFTLVHDAWVTGVEIEREGILTWSKDGTARLWDATNGLPLLPPLRHQRWVRGAAFSTDRRRILTWSEDGTARLWDATNGAPVGPPMLHSSQINDARFSPNGKWLLTASVDETACLWNGLNAAPIMTLAHDGNVLGAEYLPGGQRILTWSEDETARLWNPMGRPGSEIVMPHSGTVRGAQISADGQRVLTWTTDNTARLWRLSDGTPLGEPMVHDMVNDKPPVSADGQRILTWTFGGTVILRNATDGAPLGSPISVADSNGIYGASFSPDGERILTWGEDGIARLWNGRNAKPLGAQLKHDQPLYKAQFASDGRRILTWSGDLTGPAEVRLWTVPDEGEPRVLLKFDTEGILFAHVTFGTNGNHILYKDINRWASLVNAEDGKPMGDAMTHEGSIDEARFTDGERRILTSSEDGTVRSWKLGGRALVGSPMEHEGEVFGAQFSPDGERILTWSADTTARLWNARTGEALTTPLEHAAAVKHAEFNRTGERFLTHSSDGTAWLWNGTNGTLQEWGKWHERIVGVRFSPDGQRYLTWGSEGTARIWSATNGEALSEPLPHEGTVTHGQFDSSGRRVLTWTSKYVLHVWTPSNGVFTTQSLKIDSSPGMMPLSNDDRWMLVLERNVAHIWDLERWLPLEPSLQHSNLVSGAQFSANGQKILTWTVSTFGPGEASLWSIRTRTPIGVAMNHDRGINGAKLSVDGELVLTWNGMSSGVGEARLWNGNDGTPAGQPMIHPKGVADARFSRDRQRILTTSWDGTARLWNARNSQCLAIFRHDAGRAPDRRPLVTSAQFNSDESRVLTTSWDGTARLWDISLDGTLSVTERILEFEMRSATTLASDGQVRVLKVREWEERKQKLLEAEIQTGKAIIASGTPHRLTPDELAAKCRQLDELKSRLATAK